ncbi:hypothetical protein [Flavobacterium aestivum]|uniref:hypothetical protein n=1 Tax=Flavobacterium aestivum TaxID=3003257 RepID=UPI002482909F|nr:hypothetical protein [Flavobacterium aestivum]
MSYKALVTLDLPEATKEQREIFYQVLKDEKWTKISNLDTAWKVTFKDGVTRIDAINTIKNDLEKAKLKSKLKRVDYAIQIDVNDVIIANL